VAKSSHGKPRSNSTNAITEPQDDNGRADPEYAPTKSVQLTEEDIQDFGAWRILLSGESVRHLRQFRRGDQHMFGIIRKKMKYVAHSIAIYVT
jgi:hypothetical protein